MKRIFLYLYCLYMSAYSIRNNVRQLQLCDYKTKVLINNAQFFIYYMRKMGTYQTVQMNIKSFTIIT